MAFSRANLCDEYLKELRIPGDPLIKGQIAAVVYLALVFEIMYGEIQCRVGENFMPSR